MYIIKIKKLSIHLCYVIFCIINDKIYYFMHKNSFNLRISNFNLKI